MRWGGQSKLLIENLGLDEEIKISGDTIDDLKPLCIISDEWITKTNNKTKVRISGEVVLNDKVDCYSIEFEEGGHLTIQPDARLRIWEGGIVNNDCESVNYFTTKSAFSNNYCGLSFGELLLHPNVDFNNHPLASVEMASYAYKDNGTYKWQQWTLPLINTPVVSRNLVVSSYLFIWEESSWKQISAWSDTVRKCLALDITNTLTQRSNLIYTFTGNIIGNDNVQTQSNYSTNAYGNGYLGKMSAKKLLDYEGEVSTYIENRYITITKNNVDNYKWIYPMASILLMNTKNAHFNYKDLVWDPSFEEETESAPLMLTKSTPKSSTSIPEDSPIFKHPDIADATKIS